MISQETFANNSLMWEAMYHSDEAYLMRLIAVATTIFVAKKANQLVQIRIRNYCCTGKSDLIPHNAIDFGSFAHIILFVLLSNSYNVNGLSIFLHKENDHLSLILPFLSEYNGMCRMCRMCVIHSYKFFASLL